MIRINYGMILLVVVLMLPVVSFLAFALLGTAAPIGQVLFGWASFAGYALPRVRINWETLGSTAVFVIIFSIGLHAFCRWFANALRTHGRPEVRPWKASWTVAGVGAVFLMFAAGTAVVAAAHQVIFLSTQKKIFSAAHDGFTRIVCSSNMRQIGVALWSYASEHGGAFPPDLETLQQAQHLPPEVLHCPVAEPDEVPADGNPNAGWPPEAKYIYLGRGPTTTHSSMTPLLLESAANHGGDGAIVLFPDGHVAWHTPEEIEALFRDPPTTQDVEVQ